MPIPNLKDIIDAYECFNGPYTFEHKNKCNGCPYGYGYLNDSGDNYFWTCNDEKWENDAYFYLKIYQKLIEEKENKDEQ